MLDIIQMAFGDLNKFNDSVRSILHAIAACHASDGEKRGTCSAQDWLRACPRDWMRYHEWKVPEDSPIPSMPSPAADGVPVLPEDSPIPSMPSPKKYQWLS